MSIKLINKRNEYIAVWAFLPKDEGQYDLFNNPLVKHLIKIQRKGDVLVVLCKRKDQKKIEDIIFKKKQ